MSESGGGCCSFPPSLPPSPPYIIRHFYGCRTNERTSERTNVDTPRQLRYAPLTHSQSQRSAISDQRLTLWWLSEFAVVRSFIRLFAVTQSVTQPAVTHSLSHSLTHSTPLSVSEAFDDRSLTHSLLTAHCSLLTAALFCRRMLSHSVSHFLTVDERMYLHMTLRNIPA